MNCEGAVCFFFVRPWTKTSLSMGCAGSTQAPTPPVLCPHYKGDFCHWKVDGGEIKSSTSANRMVAVKQAADRQQIAYSFVGIAGQSQVPLQQRTWNVGVLTHDGLGWRARLRGPVGQMGSVEEWKVAPDGREIHSVFQTDKACWVGTFRAVDGLALTQTDPGTTGPVRGKWQVHPRGGG